MFEANLKHDKYIVSVKWGCIAFIALCALGAVYVVAGKVTEASIGVSFLSSFSVSYPLTAFAGASGLAYGWYQRKLRKDTIERYQGRVNFLESKIDKGRTTSNLTARGNTPGGTL